MVDIIEKTGKTIEEAISLALMELNTDEENVDIEILEEGNKGILGLLGNKMAKVRVCLKEQRGEKALNFLLDVFRCMDIDAEVEVVENEEEILLNIEGRDSGIIIGRRGETLDSLQYLTSLVVNKRMVQYKRVSIDTENYRKKREETLVRLAQRLADKVKASKESIDLEPMNPYERKIIHATLQNNRYVKTYSKGEEPNRRIVITVK